MISVLIIFFTYQLIYVSDNVSWRTLASGHLCFVPGYMNEQGEVRRPAVLQRAILISFELIGFVAIR